MLGLACQKANKRSVPKQKQEASDWRGANKVSNNLVDSWRAHYYS